MRTTVNLDKVVYVGNDQPVFFKRFCTKRAHNRNAGKICKRTREKMC